MTKFVEFLSNYMKTNRFTQLDISKKIGVKQATISRWLNGRMDIKISHFSRVCKALNIPDDKILEIVKN